MATEPEVIPQRRESDRLAGARLMNARIAMLILGTLALIIIAGAVLLAYKGEDTPDALIALAGGCIGAIAGILVPSPS